jgi:hypothetical protein
VHERGTPYADESVNGAFVGGFGCIQILQYSQSDIGVYGFSGAYRIRIELALHVYRTV